MGARTRALMQLCMVAAVLTALGGVVHSRRLLDLYTFSSSSKFHEEFFYNTVARKASSMIRGRASFLNYQPRYERTKYTFDSFEIADGINLASFGFDGIFDKILPLPSYKFELFQDFDLSNRLRGDETWVDLLEYRRDATHSSLSFYVDKVAFKRWLVTSYAELRIDTIKSFFLKYASELHRDVDFVLRRNKLEQKNPPGNPNSKEYKERWHATRAPLVSKEIMTWLPNDADYAAKPTHLSCSGGVWLVHNDQETNQTWVGNGKKKMAEYHESPDVRTDIAKDLASNLQTVQEKCGRTVIESRALRNVRPGIVVEERFTQPSRNTHDNSFLRGGMEFKVFTIWGRAWLTVWRPGIDGVKGLFFRNGTSLEYDLPVKMNKKIKKPKSVESVSLPDWIDWDRVISMAETLGRNKDMFRTDIFVGLAGDDKETIRYVVSETEIHPTPLRGFEEVFEEAGRLWLAGYYILSQHQVLQIVPNTEVPPSFFNEL